MRHAVSLFAALALTAPLMAQANISSDTKGAGTYFDFYDPSLFNLLDKTSASLSFNVGGIGLTVTPVASGSNVKVAANGKGLGVSSGLLDIGDLNGGLLGSGEGLLLTFSQAVTLNSVGLSLWDGGLLPIDKASITTAGQQFSLGNALSDNALGVTTFSMGSASVPGGRFFLLSAEGSLSSFRLAGLKVDAVSAVPEAPTNLLLGLGLAGMVALKLRRSRQN